MADTVIQRFKRDIKAFLRTHEMSRTMFGFNAARDPSFLNDLDAGERKFYPPIIASVRQWMRDYEDGTVQLVSLYSTRSKSPASRKSDQLMRAARDKAQRAAKAAELPAEPKCPRNMIWCPTCKMCKRVSKAAPQQAAAAP